MSAITHEKHTERQPHETIIQSEVARPPKFSIARVAVAVGSASVLAILGVSIGLSLIAATTIGACAGSAVIVAFGGGGRKVPPPTHNVQLRN